MQKSHEADDDKSETKAKQQHQQDNSQDLEEKQNKTKQISKKQKIRTKQNKESQSEEDEQKEDEQKNRIPKNYQNSNNQDIQDDGQLPELNLQQKIQEGEAFMLVEEREVDKNNPKYHFCRFISRHYRLIEDKKERKNHFVRLQPVFVRFLHVLKLRNLPLITIDAFRKYLKKFFKRRGMRYEQTTNRVDMKVVVGIDRRYNSKFQF